MNIRPIIDPKLKQEIRFDSHSPSFLVEAGNS